MYVIEAESTPRCLLCGCDDPSGHWQVCRRLPTQSGRGVCTTLGRDGAELLSWMFNTSLTTTGSWCRLLSQVCHAI